jgi:hypothetical protein
MQAMKPLSWIMSVALLSAAGPAAHAAAPSADQEANLSAANNANADLSGARYDLVVRRTNKDLVAYRLDRVTGETWSLDGTSLVRIKERGPIAQGNYKLAVVPTKDGKQNWVVRMDRKSGGMWYATNNQFVPYNENP